MEREIIDLTKMSLKQIEEKFEAVEITEGAKKAFDIFPIEVPLSVLGTEENAHAIQMALAFAQTLGADKIMHIIIMHGIYTLGPKRMAKAVFEIEKNVDLEFNTIDQLEEIMGRLHPSHEKLVRNYAMGAFSEASGFLKL